VELRAPDEPNPITPDRQPFAGLGRGDDELGRALDDIAERFGVPAAVINILDDDRHLEDFDAAKLTQLTIDSQTALIVHTNAHDARIGDNSYLLTNGIDFYASVPLVLADGRKIGALALIDYEPHAFTPEDAERLAGEAAALVERFG